jgi:multidrug efflux pump subunit AcrB
VVVSGANTEANEAYANAVAAKMNRIAGIADVRLQQPSNYPQLDINIDRAHADRLGITENDVTRALSTNLSGSSQVAPTFWLNPKNGVSYPIVVQAPQYAADSISALNNVSVTGVGGFQTLSGVGISARARGRDRHPLRHPPRDRRLCHHAGPRSGRRGGRHPEGAGRTQQDLPKGATVTARSGADDERPSPA